MNEHVDLAKTGVYCITNTVNQRIYVGSTGQSFRARWNLHKSQLRGRRHHSILLQRSWDKYGEKSFVFSVLLECGVDDCVANEQKLIDALDSTDPSRGFNISPTAGSCIGVKLSDETRARMRASMTPERRQKIADQTRKAMTPERRAEQSGHRRGKPLSEEHKRKIGMASVGRAHTADAREKMSAAKRGLVRTAAHCEAIAASKRGLKHSDETRAKMSASHRRRAAKKAGAA